MSGRREIKGRIRTLFEINGILGAMKNLALMELQKLGRFSGMQRRVVQSIEAAAADFLNYYPDALPSADDTFEAFLLIGSERGFCGDFNDSVIDAFRSAHPVPGSSVIAVGSRLAARLDDAVGNTIAIQGTGVAEEVEAVLAKLVDALSDLQRDHGQRQPLGLTAFYHDQETESIRARRLMPMADFPGPQRALSYPPLLNLPPAQLVPELMNQYMFAVLHEVLFSSLYAENQWRLVHMDGAMHRLEDDLARLKIKYNALRQEEIVEEIEVILLSAEALGEG